MDFMFPSSATLEFKLRDISIEDYPAVYRIAEVTWNKTFKNILTADQINAGITSSYTAEAINTALENDERFLVLTECSHLVAFAAYKKTATYLEKVYTQKPVPTSMQLTKLYCLPEYQGKGCGKQLLQNIEDTARAEKVESLHVLVNRYNTNAIDFYKNQGYETLGELNEEYGGFLREDFVMFKLLK